MIRAAPRPALRGLADVISTARVVGGNPVLLSMCLLAACASFAIGNSYQAQMPGFARDLGHGDVGILYGMLLGADAAGAAGSAAAGAAAVGIPGGSPTPAARRTASASSVAERSAAGSARTRRSSAGSRSSSIPATFGASAPPTAPSNGGCSASNAPRPRPAGGCGVGARGEPGDSSGAFSRA